LLHRRRRAAAHTVRSTHAPPHSPPRPRSPLTATDLPSSPDAATWANGGACRGQRGRPALRTCVRVVCPLCVVKRPAAGRAPALRAGGSRAGWGLAIGPTGENGERGRDPPNSTKRGDTAPRPGPPRDGTPDHGRGRRRAGAPSARPSQPSREGAGQHGKGRERAAGGRERAGSWGRRCPPTDLGDRVILG
jgi:hypothetical protein